MSAPTRTNEMLARMFLWFSAIITIAALVIILGYVFAHGLAYVDLEFLLAQPMAMGREGGIFPMIVATVLLVVVTLAVATPLGVGAAIYLTEYTHRSWITRVIRFGTESLAGVPSIIFGLFGFVFFVIYLRLGWSILSGGLTVALMILPTVIRTSEEAIKSVPRSYREGSLALGATKWQTITKVVLPTALPGIITGVILGIGRAVGETAATMLTAGMTLNLPRTFFESGRTMSVHLYALATGGISMEKAYATAVVLIITILIINTLANWITHRFIARTSQG